MTPALAKVACERLGHLGRVDLAVAELHGVVAVAFLGLDGRDHVGGDVYERDRDEEAVLIPDLRHAELLAQ